MRTVEHTDQKIVVGDADPTQETVQQALRRIQECPLQSFHGGELCGYCEQRKRAIRALRGPGWSKVNGL